LTIYCPNCGEKNGEGAKFCKKCGKSLGVSPESSTTPSNVTKSRQEGSKRNLLIIIIALVVCVAAVAGAFLYFYGDFFKEPAHIVNTTFTTGHALEDKTICTINVGSNHSDENITAKILYSRDGVNLNTEYEYNETVDANGDIICESLDSFGKFPDHASVTIYDDEGNKLDSVKVNLSTDDSTQVAIGNGTVKAKSITAAQHSASSNSASSSSSSSSGSGSDEWVEDLDLSDKAGYDAHVYIHHKSDGTKYYIDEDGNKHTGSENEEWVF
jgi:hypothetical protein